MPDIRNLVITPQTSANVNVPRATISCTIHDSKTGAQLFDFTGANAVAFPGILSTLTAADRLELLHLILTWLLAKRMGA